MALRRIKEAELRMSCRLYVFENARSNSAENGANFRRRAAHRAV
jgi:hypothetical protein